MNLRNVLRKCKLIKVAETTCGQILAYQISEFPIDGDQSSKYFAARVISYYFW